MERDRQIDGNRDREREREERERERERECVCDRIVQKMEKSRKGIGDE